MARRNTGGFALIETAVIAAAATVLVTASAWTIGRAVEVAQEAAEATAAQSRARLALDRVEATLTSASRGSMECVLYDEVGPLENFCSSVESSVGGFHPEALPLEKGVPVHNLFFLPDSAALPGNPGPLRCYFLRPEEVQDPGAPGTVYELAYFDGQTVETVLGRITRAEFKAKRNGLVKIKVRVIVKQKKNKFRTKRITRAIVTRMS